MIDTNKVKDWKIACTFGNRSFILSNCAVFIEVSVFTAGVCWGRALFPTLQLTVCAWLFDDSWSLIASNFNFFVPITNGFDLALSEPYIWQSRQYISSVAASYTSQSRVFPSRPLYVKTSFFLFFFLIVLFIVIFLLLRYNRGPLYASYISPHFGLNKISDEFPS